MRGTIAVVSALFLVSSMAECKSDENFDFVSFVTNSPAFKLQIGVRVASNEIQSARFWEQRSNQMNGLMLPVFGDQCTGQANVSVIGLQGGAFPTPEFIESFARWLLAQGYIHRQVFTLRKMYNGKEIEPETRRCLTFDEKLKDLTTIQPSDTIDRYSAVTIVAAERKFGGIVSQNSFQITAPMQFTVYRAVFSYSIESKLPMINYPGAASGEVQVFKNPETTQWTLKSYILRDPTPQISN